MARTAQFRRRSTTAFRFSATKVGRSGRCASCPGRYFPAAIAPPTSASASSPIIAASSAAQWRPSTASVKNVCLPLGRKRIPGPQQTGPRRGSFRSRDRESCDSSPMRETQPREESSDRLGWGPMGLSLGGLCVFPHCRVFAPRAEIISVLPYIFAQENRSSRNALTRKLAIAFGILTEVRHGYNHYANKSTSLADSDKATFRY